MSHSLSVAYAAIPLGRPCRSQGTTPWASLALSALAVGLYLLPGWGTRLGYDRAALADGQIWRLLTGHWTHWSTEHLGWSLVVFLFLGLFWEKTGRRRSFLVCTVGSALFISAAVWLFQPGMTFYRGLSGVDCALVTAVACEALGRARRNGQQALTWGLALTLAGYGCKVVYEIVTGGTVFVSAASASFSAVPLAHLAGGGFGLLLAAWHTRFPAS